MPPAPSLSPSVTTNRPSRTPSGVPVRSDRRLAAIPDETVVVRRAARAAEDAGDLLGARRLVDLLPPDADRCRWRASLDEGLRLRAVHPVAAADPGAAAAWWSAPAMRFGLTSPRAEQLLGLAATVLQGRGVPSPQRHRMAPTALQEEPALLDAALCDLGVLPMYLEQLAGALRRELDSLAAWSSRPATVWEVEAHEPGGLVVGDASGSRRTVTATSLRSAAPVPALGALLYGRVVPLPALGAASVTNPVWGFAVRPVPVNRLAARRVMRAVTRGGSLAERIRAVTPTREPVGPRARATAAVPASGPV